MCRYFDFVDDPLSSLVDLAVSEWGDSSKLRLPALEHRHVLRCPRRDGVAIMSPQSLLQEMGVVMRAAGNLFILD